MLPINMTLQKSFVIQREWRTSLFPLANSMICMLVIGYYLSITRRLERLSFRYFYDAIPAALTNIAIGKKGLISSQEVQSYFQDRIPNVTDSDLLAGLQIAKVIGASDGQTRIFLGDDLGLPHFVQLALSIFGLHVWSVHLLFGSLFTVTTFLVIWSFRRECWVQFVLFAYQISFALVTPNLFVSGQLWTWTDPRAVSILAVSPAIFIVAFALHSKKQPLILAILLVQILVLVFIIHVRFASIWAVMGSLIATIILASVDRSTMARRFWPPVAKCVSIVCSVLLLSLLLASFATDSLKLSNSDRAPARHLFWHSVVTAESLGNIGKTRGQIFDDASTHELVRNFLIERGEYLGVQKVFGVDIPAGDYSQVDWRSYEDSARALFLQDIKEKPRELIRLLFVEKPVLWLQSISWFVGIPWGESVVLLEQQLEFPTSINFLRVVGTIVVVALFGFLLSCLVLKTCQGSMQASSAKGLVVLMSMFVAAVLPTIGLIPLVHVISDSVVLTFSLVISFVALLVVSQSV